MTRWTLMIATVLLLAAPSLARGADWAPGPGERSELTRTGPDLSGIGFLFPLRLHLSRGGFVDGRAAGTTPEARELLLVVEGDLRLRVDLSLVSAVTPLAALPPADAPASLRTLPGLAAEESVTRLRPTWRSGVGLAFNLVAPGTGHFIQKKEPGLGFLFLGMDLFFVGAGLLAVLAPSRLGATERAYFGIAFFSFDLLTRGVAAAHAFSVGREPTRIPTTELRAPGLRR